jgi:hypothetical protein
MKLRRRTPPRPPAPPAGFMWLYWELVPTEEAELRAKQVMRAFDRLPRKQRDRENYRGERDRARSR